MERFRNGQERLWIDVVDRAAAVPLTLIHLGGAHEAYDKSPIIWAHRNGHGSMFQVTREGAWRMTKFWKDADEAASSASDFARPEVEDLFPLISVGEEELLTFLPKSLGERPRTVIYREHMLDYRWDKRDGFTLHHREYGESPMFEGKLWESLEAVVWCQERLPSVRETIERERAWGTADQPVAALSGAASQSPLWGMF